MNDFIECVPHAQRDKKVRGDQYVQLNEMAEAKDCDSIILFETRHGSEHYVWFAITPGGPSVCFYVENMHSIEELHLPGRCQRGSRPLLLFDPAFDSSPELGIAKEILSRAFGLPFKTSHKIVDSAYAFFFADSHIWFSRYQVMQEASGEVKLREAGPRFCLRLVRILGGSFCGRMIYSNPDFVPPRKMGKGT